jgi:hypothetical protein
VFTGIEGSFCQLCHGKSNPIERLTSGDWIVYHSPRTARVAKRYRLAIGQILARGSYPFDMGNGFVPARRDVHFLDATEAPIRSLIEDLAFIKNKKCRWELIFLQVPCR